MLYFRRYCLTKTFAAKWGEWGLVWLDEHRRGYIGFLQAPPEKEDLEKVDWVCKGGVDVQVSVHMLGNNSQPLPITFKICLRLMTHLPL